MVTVGVLCARVRVEEKLLLAALAEAGALPAALPPADLRLPVGPPPISRPSHCAGEGEAAGARVIVDRCQDRALAAAILPACRALGAATLDAGLAATGDRLAVATALATAGLPRPETCLACSPEAALLALAEFGYPGTLLPLAAGTSPVVLHDADAAEAVLEHRSVLGSTAQALALVQAGAAETRASVVVVDGRAVAVAAANGAAVAPAALRAAERAADALDAGVIAVEVAWTASGPVVWDVAAVPEFRHATPLGEVTVAAALATAAIARLGAKLGAVVGRGSAGDEPIGLDERHPVWGSGRVAREAADGVVLSA